MTTNTRMSPKGIFILTVGLLMLLAVSLAQLRAEHFVRPDREARVSEPAGNAGGELR